MNPSTFLPFKTLICFVNGLGALLVPEWYLGIFGLTLDPAGLLMARFMGASLIGIGLICWFYRNAGYKTIQDILLSLFIADSVGTIAALMAQLSGLTNSLGWLVVAMWLVLAAGLGYLRFVKPQTQAAAVGRS